MNYAKAERALASARLLLADEDAAYAIDLVQAEAIVQDAAAFIAALNTLPQK